MSTVGVRELKNSLTRYLRRTRQGEEVVVTDRGKPIAVIQPMRSARALASVEARLAKMAAIGALSLPTAKSVRGLRRITVRGRPISRTILDDRR